MDSIVLGTRLRAGRDGIAEDACVMLVPAENAASWVLVRNRWVSVTGTGLQDRVTAIGSTKRYKIDCCPIANLMVSRVAHGVCVARDRIARRDAQVASAELSFQA